MRNSVTRLALAGFGHVLPCLTREFSGKVSWTITAYPFPKDLPTPASKASIHPRLWLDVADIVAHRIGVHRPVVDRHRLFSSVDPGERMFHPVDVVALGIILARMRSAAFEAVEGALHRHHRLHDQIVVFERLDEIGVPDERTVGHGDVGAGAPGGANLFLTLSEHFAGAEHGAIVLHDALHVEAKRRGWGLAFGVAEPVEAGERELRAVLGEFGLTVAGPQRLGGAQARCAAEDDEVDQRIGAEPV